MKNILILFFSILCLPLFSQGDASISIFPNKDTSNIENKYYTDLTDQLVLKFTNSIKWSKLDITNRNTNKTLKLAPAGSLELGGAFNYKWLGLGFSYGLPPGAASDSTRGKTKRFDLQLNIYAKNFVVDALYQKYRGFYVSNPGNFTVSDTTAGANDFAHTAVLPQLPNMEYFSLGISAYYIFNYKKFSYRAAYVRNAVQKKSKGSLLVGPFLNIDGSSTLEGFIPKNMPTEVQDTFNIGFFSSTSYGLAVGYTYSVIIGKKVFMNFSIVPGIGVKNLKTEFNGVQRASKKGVATRVTYRFAIGYEHRAFLLGLTLYGTQGSIVIDNFLFSPGAGMLNLFVGKRFDFKKNKNKLKID